MMNELATAQQIPDPPRQYFPAPVTTPRRLEGEVHLVETHAPDPRPPVPLQLPVQMGHLEGVVSPAFESKFDAIDRELEKLRRPDEQEAKRLERIAQLQAEKAETEARNREAVRQAEVEFLRPDFELAMEEWRACETKVEEALLAVMEAYQNEALPALRRAYRIQNQLVTLGEAPRNLPPCPGRAQDWLAMLLRRGRITKEFRDRQSRASE